MLNSATTNFTFQIRLEVSDPDGEKSHHSKAQDKRRAFQYEELSVSENLTGDYIVYRDKYECTWREENEETKLVTRDKTSDT